MDYKSGNWSQKVTRLSTSRYSNRCQIRSRLLNRLKCLGIPYRTGKDVSRGKKVDGVRTGTHLTLQWKTQLFSTLSLKCQTSTLKKKNSTDSFLEDLNPQVCLFINKDTRIPFQRKLEPFRGQISRSVTVLHTLYILMSKPSNGTNRLSWDSVRSFDRGATYSVTLNLLEDRE